MGLDEIFEKAFHSETKQAQFFYELLLHDIYIIATGEEGVAVKQGEHLQVFTIRDEDEIYVPVFLSMNALEIFLKDTDSNFVKANAVDVLETLKGYNIVINPGQEKSIVLYAYEVEALLKQGLN